MKPLLLVLGAFMLLSGCGAGDNMEDVRQPSLHEMNHADSDGPGMRHDDSGTVPPGLKAAAHPAYPPGSRATVKADHMPGMKGAVATIAGAYDTIVYAVTYTPATGGEPVRNHKWVIQREIRDAGDHPLEPGTGVVLEANHMPGMMGASATVESAERTTVYMIDYVPATGGEPVRNHKWVTEGELSAADV